MSRSVSPPRRQAGNASGKLITAVLVLALLAFGAWLVMRDMGKDEPAGATTSQAAAGNTDGKAPVPVEPQAGLPNLDAAATYQPKGNVVDVDVSEYAGYAGLIAANGGLEPNPDSFFAREYGFQVRLSLNEEEGWSKLNNGRVAASVTTADTLAVLGRQFDVVVPAQIGFSRGADAMILPFS